MVIAVLKLDDLIDDTQIAFIMNDTIGGWILRIYFFPERNVGADTIILRKGAGDGSGICMNTV
jgi:hypothetical protein